jgi:hypothetical protein
MTCTEITNLKENVDYEKIETLLTKKEKAIKSSEVHDIIHFEWIIVFSSILEKF